ncbi:MAG: hypothetical protein I8H75_02345 [Myxococcaceae bacterium]|nr:hypothetical protein [Myxococcaceae bacterium]MBH2006175.1 hypothetical protein [Myxococcaceae bacterium]
MERLNFETLEQAVAPVFREMQRYGLYVNRKAWVETIEVCRTEMLKYQKLAMDCLSGPQHLDLFGESSLNLNSPADVAGALSKCTNPAEAQASLDRYREMAKLVQTYGATFIEFIDPISWRIHAHFESTGASTGRVSCHRPNLQNLPSDTRFQACLSAPAGRAIVRADYAACELRILADFSGDASFLKAFEDSEDLHTQVAINLFGSPTYREQAKAINFGIIYGMGSKSLAASLQVTQNQAEEWLKQYFKKHPRIKAYLDWSVQEAYAKGYAQTRLGRRLALNTSQDISRVAKNMPIQGTAAELAKLAMVWVHRRLSQDFQEAVLVNMIHDELVVECQEADQQQVAEVLVYEMERAQKRICPRVQPKAESVILPYRP